MKVITFLQMFKGFDALNYQEIPKPPHIYITWGHM
jgi:hypothetical protein